MVILGDANWKLPRFLERWLPHFRVVGEAARIEAAGTRPTTVPEPVAG